MTETNDRALERVKLASCWIEETGGRLIYHFACTTSGGLQKVEYAVNHIEDMDLESLTSRANDLKSELARQKVELEATVLALDPALVMHESLAYPRLARKEITRTREMHLADLYPHYPEEYSFTMTERQDKSGVYQEVYLVRKALLTKALYLLRRASIKVTSIIRLTEALAARTFADGSLVIALQLKRTLVIAKDKGEALACFPCSTGYSVFRERSENVKALFDQINFAYDRMADHLTSVNKVYLFFDKTMNALEKAALTQGELSEITAPIDATFHSLIIACARPKVSFPVELS